jgi:hypothetical protein
MLLHVSWYHPAAEGLTINRLPCVARKSLKLPRVNGLQLRASERANNFANGTCQRIECAEKDVWLSLSSKLVDVTSEVVALCECRRVENTASQVCDVDSGERIGSSSVAAHVLVRVQAT